MPAGLYKQDFLLWTEEQARLLRRVASGERSAAAAVDWASVIEELEGVARSDIRACRSLLRAAMEHLLKLHAWPGDRSARHWANEARAALDDAREAFSPSMRRHISLRREYSRAAGSAEAAQGASGPPRPWPDACPWALDGLLDEEAEVPALAAMLGGSDA